MAASTEVYSGDANQEDSTDRRPEARAVEADAAIVGTP